MQVERKLMRGENKKSIFQPNKVAQMLLFSTHLRPVVLEEDGPYLLRISLPLKLGFVNTYPDYAKMRLFSDDES